MLNVLRFAAYALAFERAYRTDDCRKVGKYFTGGARYLMNGGPPFEGESRGRAEIVEGFRRSVDAFDRKFDRRIPRITTVPRTRDGWLTFGWQVTYVKGEDRFRLHGTTHCQHQRGRIAVLRDAMDPTDCAAAAIWITRLR
jgi:hypothetical protein